MSTELAVLIAMAFSALGTAKVVAARPMRERAAHVGMSVAAYRRIGVLEIAGAGGVLAGLKLPLLGVLAGTGLLLLMVGALITHLRLRDRPVEIAPAAVAATLVTVYLAGAL